MIGNTVSVHPCALSTQHKDSARTKNSRGADTDRHDRSNVFWMTWALTRTFHYTSDWVCNINSKQKAGLPELMRVSCHQTSPRAADKGKIPLYRSADKSLARQGRKQATATEDFDVHISYL